MIKTLIEKELVFGSLDDDKYLQASLRVESRGDHPGEWVVGYRFFDWGVTYTLGTDKEEIKSSNTMSYEVWQKMDDEQVQRLYNLI
ncbi:MAG: hypothetical protein GY940_34725 [bacterium]|nr:hypothetical protein [bacterium]